MKTKMKNKNDQNKKMKKRVVLTSNRATIYFITSTQNNIKLKNNISHLIVVVTSSNNLSLNVSSMWGHQPGDELALISKHYSSRVHVNS